MNHHNIQMSSSNVLRVNSIIDNNANNSKAAKRSQSLDETSSKSSRKRRKISNITTISNKAETEISMLKPDLLPLALRKIDRKYCEICNADAYFSCPHCKNSFYCTKEHMKLDMQLMHPRVCKLLELLKSKLPHSNLKAERERLKAERTAQTRSVTDISYQMAKRSLQYGKPNEAFIQISYCIRFAHKIHKPDDVGLIPFLLVFAEVYAADGKMQQALQYLAKTESIILRAAQCPLAIKADFYKTKGTIGMLASDYLDALHSFSEEIIFATEAYHTEHRRTAMGYFNLGTVFHKLDKNDIAHSLFMHFTEIMIATLFEEYQFIMNLEAQELLVMQDPDAKKGNLSEELLMDIRNRLKSIYEFRSRLDPSVVVRSTDGIKVCYALSLFHYVVGEYKSGLRYVERANKILNDGLDPDEVKSSNASANPTPQTSPTSGWWDKFKQVKKHLQRQLSRAGKETTQKDG